VAAGQGGFAIFNPGPREESKTRHPIARSSDGCPEFATTIPDSWSEDELTRSIIGKYPQNQPTPPPRNRKKNNKKTGRNGMRARPLAICGNQKALLFHSFTRRSPATINSAFIN
jgi:hypothetical protein